ncbi:MAG: hypothetical protein U0905_22455 [Pirellulales bacterium]
MMIEWNPSLDGIRMCLNHAQSDIESSFAEIDATLRKWECHAGNPIIRTRLLEQLTDARWLLEQHFERIAGEGYFEQIVDQRPSLYERFRDVENMQEELLRRFDQLIIDIRGLCVDSRSIANILNRFRQFHEELLREECEEREMLELVAFPRHCK